MFGTESFRNRLEKKLAKRGWSHEDAEAAGYAVFPMTGDPGDRSVEDYLRSRSRVLAQVVHKRSVHSETEQKELVYEALTAYAGVCREVCSETLARIFERPAQAMSVALPISST